MSTTKKSTPVKPSAAKGPAPLRRAGAAKPAGKPAAAKPAAAAGKGTPAAAAAAPKKGKQSDFCALVDVVVEML